MMIIAVDDEYHALAMLGEAIGEAMPEAMIKTFEEPEDALAFAKQNQVDVAFLDIEMREMSGLALAKKLKDLYGLTNIVFVTGFDKYALDAMQLHASGYIGKPVSAEDILRELENLRHPVQPEDRGVRVQCFGNFEVFVDGAIVSFNRAKSKEALAYLVDRQGAGVSNKEIAAVLWEDAPYDRSKQKQLDNILAEMLRALRASGAGEIILKRSGVYAVDTTKLTCDVYGYRSGIASAVNAYRGEYMANYSWAEFTAGQLAKQ